MPNQLGLLTAALLVALTTTAAAAVTHYVNVNGHHPNPPYLNWGVAAVTIQDAVDVAAAGDVIVVANGVYNTGGRSVYGTMTNRVAIDRALLVRSVNGPAVTSIVGGGPTNGPSAVRCVYLTNGAVLTGFTLTNGATQGYPYSNYKTTASGGGVWCEGWRSVVSNCVLTGNSAYVEGGGAYYGTLHNCTLTDNSVTGIDGRGGGACYSLLNDCTLSGNSATGRDGMGGGAYGRYPFTIINNCAFTSNSASSGGGAMGVTLNNCTFTGNWADVGGGSDGGYLSNCKFTDNSAHYFGGGASYGTLTACTLVSNSARYYGGGAYHGTLTACTLVGNSASGGGGVYDSTLNNCIAYYNNASAGLNYDGSPTFNYSCITPLPSGQGNITNEPLFMDTNGWTNLRLQSNSPCINAGNNTYATNSTDLDGNPRIAGATVDMGAYEFQGTGLSGFTGWLWQHGLRVDGTADTEDSDGDTMNNWREWRCDTDPTNALSILQMLSPASAESGLTVSWQSVNTRSYFLERATDLDAQPPFQTLQTNITGQAGITTYTDTNATGPGPFFYRVGLQQ